MATKRAGLTIFCPRIHTDVKLGTRSDREQRMADKLPSVQRHLA